MKRYLIEWVAVLSGTTGAILRIIVYQYGNGPHDAPEWIFNMDSIGYFLECLCVLLLIEAIKPKSWLIIPASTFCYVSAFDAIKEVIGLNEGKSTFETAFFCFFLLLIIFATYNVYKQRNPD